MSEESYACADCGIVIDRVSECSGVIFAHRKDEGGWASLPICTLCWVATNPDREPARVRWELL